MDATDERDERVKPGWLPEKGHPDRIGVYVVAGSFALLVVAIILAKLVGYF